MDISGIIWNSDLKQSVIAVVLWLLYLWYNIGQLGICENQADVKVSQVLKLNRFFFQEQYQQWKLQTKK